MVCIEFFNLGGNIFLKLMVRIFDIFMASGSEILIFLVFIFLVLAAMVFDYYSYFYYYFLFLK